MSSETNFALLFIWKNLGITWFWQSCQYWEIALETAQFHLSACTVLTGKWSITAWEFIAVAFNRKGNHTRLFSCRKEKNTMKEAFKELGLRKGREQRKRKIKVRTWKLVLKVSHNLFHGFFFSFRFPSVLISSFLFPAFFPLLLAALQASDRPSQLPCWTRMLLGFWNIHTNGIRELPSAKRSGIVTAGDGLRIANPSSPCSD